jgi:hypothetical protein
MTDPPQKNGKNTGIGKGRPPFETRFKPGNSGRPKGSRNRASVVLDALNDSDLEAIVEKVVAKAKEGDLTAAKIIFDRVMPAPRARAVAIDLAEVDRYDGDEATLRSYAAIVGAVASGAISPGEAVELAELVDKQRQAFADVAPARMRPQPTPEQAQRQRRSDEANQRIADRLLDAVAR